MSAGLASWPGIDAPVEVTRCASDECDWVTIDDELEVVVARQHSLAA
ncbi:hypothetical protein CLV49_0087 [Labedella gwakjiensis]|nr:hypothetical protein CLV49_0087 [Labedella gwakjiensis]